MKPFIRIAVISLWVMLAASTLAIVYGFFAAGGFTPAYIFDANFLAGAGVICVALVILVLPSRVKLDKLTDHSTLADRHYERYIENKPKRAKAYRLLFSGILVIVVAGLVQLVLAQVIT